MLSTLLVMLMLPVGRCETSQAILDAIDMKGLQSIGEEAGVDAMELVGRLISGEIPLEDFQISHLFGEIARKISMDFKAICAGMMAPMLISLVSRILLGQRADSAGVVRYVCRVGCIWVLTWSFARLCSVAQTLLNALLRCSDALTPALIAAMSLSGAEASAASLTPLTAVCTDLTQNIVGRWGVSLSICATGIAVAGNLSESIKLKRLHRLFKQLLQWGLGLLMTGFMGLVSVQGRLATGRDTAVTRTTRYAIESVIPIVGGNVSDSLDSILATAGVVRNAVGVTGLILLCALCLAPLARIAATSLLFKAISAVSEPLGDSALTELTSQFADAAEMLLVAAVTALLLSLMLVGGTMSAAGSLSR